MSELSEKLTHKQIENWRRFMIIYLGVKALYLTDEEVQNIRDQVSANFTSEGGSSQPVPLPFLRVRA